MEPRAGVEPAIKVLPTYALPLGDRGNPNLQKLPLPRYGPKVIPRKHEPIVQLWPSSPKKQKPPEAFPEALATFNSKLLPDHLHAPCATLKVPLSENFAPAPIDGGP